MSAQFPIVKKVIEFGWDVATPAYLRDHVRDMERRPFDGVIFRLPEEVGAARVFETRQWARVSQNQIRLAEEVDTAGQIQWERFTDNFIVIYAASSMDWFSDDDWEQVLANLRYVARVANVAGCKGLCWDAEPYGNNPWIYARQPRAHQHSFHDYMKMVRQRGAQFMRAFAQEMPGKKLISLRLLSDFVDGSPFSNHAIIEFDNAKREQLIESAYYGLHPDFFNGLLDAIPSDIGMTDGNEDAYYYTSQLDFYRSYHTLKQRVLPLVAPENRAKYKAQVDVSQALYMDYVFARLDSLYHFPLELPRQSHMLTPEERAMWYEHNVYYGLVTAEEYVWLWNESMNWWTGEGIPPGMEAAIISAKRKYHAGEPLGFAVETMLQDAQARARQECEARRVKGFARIPRRPASQLLSPFVLAMNSHVDPQDVGPTLVRVGYDDQGLHFAIECRKPYISPRILEIDPTLDVWADDTLQIFLGTGEVQSMFQFVAGPHSEPSSSLPDEREIGSQTPLWHVSITVDLEAWMMEAVIPWRTLGSVVPNAGMQLRANICRDRPVYSIQELENRSQALVVHQRAAMSWSQVFVRFNEWEHCGAWVL